MSEVDFRNGLCLLLKPEILEKAISHPEFLRRASYHKVKSFENTTNRIFAEFSLSFEK